MDSSARQLEIFKAQDFERRDTPTTFLSLPPELRLKIYSLCVPRGCIVANNGSFLNPRFYFTLYEDRDLAVPRKWRQGSFNAAILRVSRESSEECLNMLYGDNTFIVDLVRQGQLILQDAFTNENMQRIRHVYCVIQLSLGSYEIEFLPRPSRHLWMILFPQLRSFAFRAIGQADCARTTLAMWAVSSRRSKDGWLELVESSFQLFGKLLADAGDIQVDICVSLEAVEIAQRNIPERYTITVTDQVNCICGRGCTNGYGCYF